MRLPPDLPPAPWELGTPIPGDSGYDGSVVTIPNPEPDVNESASIDVEIVGSGTPKAIAIDADNRFLYVLASDQGHENVAENAQLFDGGYHVPHLYVLDLQACDLTSQMQLDLNAPSVARYRLNKVIKAEFEDGKFGSVLVNSTIDAFPTTGTGALGTTRVTGASMSEIGGYYPGEHQLDPTARTRMLFVRNPNLASDPDRLYIRTVGRQQLSDDNAELGPIVGAIFVLSVDGNGVPHYLDTLTLDQELNADPVHAYQVAALDILPQDPAWTLTDRNVVIVAGLDGRPTENQPSPPRDRLVIIEDR